MVALKEKSEDEQSHYNITSSEHQQAPDRCETRAMDRNNFDLLTFHSMFNLMLIFKSHWKIFT